MTVLCRYLLDLCDGDDYGVSHHDCNGAELLLQVNMVIVMKVMVSLWMVMMKQGSRELSIGQLPQNATKVFKLYYLNSNKEKIS